MYSIVLMTRSRPSSDAHGPFTPEILKLPQATWIATFLEGVTDKNTGLPREHCWSIEGWIHSQRRNRLHQKLVEELVRAHTNLVLRESLHDTLRDLLPWDIELVIDEPVDEKEEEPEV